MIVASRYNRIGRWMMLNGIVLLAVFGFSALLATMNATAMSDAASELARLMGRFH